MPADVAVAPQGRRSDVETSSEVVVAVQDFGALPVMLVGRPPGLSVSIAAGLRGRGIEVVDEAPPCDPSLHGSRPRSDHPGGVRDAGGDSIGSAILVLDGDCAASLFGEPRSGRRRLNACENAWSATAFTNVLNRGARRVLVVCDARRLSFGQRMRAIRWVRNLAHRIGYEGSINGLQGLVTSYAVVDTDDDVERIADAVVKWHSGRTANHHSAGQSLTPLFAARPRSNSNRGVCPSPT